MNIGIVTESYEYICDGYTIYVSNLYRNLLKHGHNVYIFTPKYPELIFNNSQIISLPSFYPRIIPPYRISNPWHTKKIFYTLFKQLNLDIIHSQIPSFMIYSASDACQKLAIPHIATYHTFLERLIKYYLPTTYNVSTSLARLYTHSVCKYIDCVIAPSRTIKDLLLKYGVKTNIECIPHYIDSDNFQNPDGNRIRKELRISDNDKILLYVGRLTAEKNIPFLFKVLRNLLTEYNFKNVKLLIVGTGIQETEIKRQCLKMGLSNAVIFIGLIKNRCLLADYYSSADIFVFPSITEVFGLVLLEAQMCGTPVIAIDEGGVRDVIENGNGGFLTKHDIQQFTDATYMLLTDNELREKQSYKARINASKYCADFLTDKLLTIYSNIIEGKKKKFRT